MLIKKSWDAKFNRYTYTGYFLFGLIPLYIDRRTNY